MPASKRGGGEGWLGDTCMQYKKRLFQKGYPSTTIVNMGSRHYEKKIATCKSYKLVMV